MCCKSTFLMPRISARPLAKLCGIPNVLRVRNNLGYWLTRRHRVMGQLVRPFVDATLTNTDEGKESLIARDGLSENRVVVLENGVDTSRFRRFMLPDTSKKQVRVGCVANLRPVKNIDGLMRGEGGSGAIPAVGVRSGRRRRATRRTRPASHRIGFG